MNTFKRVCLICIALLVFGFLCLSLAVIAKAETKVVVGLNADAKKLGPCAHP